ncbi:hypothetical protein [Cryptosporangium japonicum]|uniref:Uncharacterized protein n=1 Tax=Cryptosporangium japonicum TaxID=80872 RepID=A0ABP3D1B4_9ACTN
MFELHCAVCARPGAVSQCRDEVRTLVTLHNDLIHRGGPVAVLRRRRSALMPRAAAA